MDGVLSALFSFALERELSPFFSSEVRREKNESIFKTSDGRVVYRKVLERLSRDFRFSVSRRLWEYFTFCGMDEIKKRQQFFSWVGEQGFSGKILEGMKLDTGVWRVPYSFVVVTEDESYFSRLKELGCPVSFLVNESDVSRLDDYEVVQCIGCDSYSLLLERLPQAVFLDSLDDVYLERFVQQLSRWSSIIGVLKGIALPGEMQGVVDSLSSLLSLTRLSFSSQSEEELASAVERINQRLSVRLADVQVSGSALVQLMQGGALPVEIKTAIREEIEKEGILKSLVIAQYPVQLDEEAVELHFKSVRAKAGSLVADQLVRQAGLLREVPALLTQLGTWIVVYDFMSGLSGYLAASRAFPAFGDVLHFSDSLNLFLEKPSPISFSLDASARCSILTGANSGGKTTLLEHVLQLICLSSLGLPVSGLCTFPLFDSVYYFAKNKGSASKGAFETLLTQLAGVSPSGSCLVLADEIEAVTEPGVAGNIIAATVSFFVDKGCFLIIATHLGEQLQSNLPGKTRIDGIAATGLTDDFELIVNHNPVLGKLAPSTPELIVERLSKLNSEGYYLFLHEYLQSVKEAIKKI